MALSETVQTALNEQIKNEFYSAYLYLSMSAYFEAENWPGFAHWTRRQYEEETGHGLKIVDHVVDRDGRVLLQTIDAPPSNFSSPLAIFEQALAHERSVTQMIQDLYKLAQRENDYPAQVMLQWFISEQVEEEKAVTQIVEDLKRAGKDNTALLMLDRQLGARQAEATVSEAT
jgi:ferritin